MAITTPAGFRITSTEPIDSRITLTDSASRYALSPFNIYEGLLVYQQDNNTVYTLIDTGSVDNSAGWTQLGLSASYAITASYAPDSRPYTSYVAVLSQSGYDIAISGGLLTVGEQYIIEDYNASDNFSNVGGPGVGSNNQWNGTRFKATGKPPLDWTNNSSLRTQGVPIPTSILENTLGFIPNWNRKNPGIYYFPFPTALPPENVVSYFADYRINKAGVSAPEIRYDIMNPTQIDADGFEADGKPNGSVFAVLAHSTGSIFAGGAFTLFGGGGGGGVMLVKLTDRGEISATVTNFANSIRAIIELSDGSILIGTEGGELKKYSETLVPDTSFNGNVTPANIFDKDGGIVYTLAQQPDGKILVGGDFGVYPSGGQTSILRLNTNGTLDTTFNVGNAGIDGGLATVNTIAVDTTNNKILLGGAFNTYNGSEAKNFVRLNSNGTYDDNFMNNLTTYHTGMFNNIVNAIAVQENGYIIGGEFTGWYTDGASGVRKYILKIKTTADEDVDWYYNLTGADPSAGFNQAVTALVVGNDNRLYVGGRFDRVKNTFSYRIAKLYKDGGLDMDFSDTVIGMNDDVYCLSLSTTGSVYVGGVFTAFQDSSTQNYLARILNEYQYYIYCSDKTTYLDNLLKKQPIEVRIYN